MARIERAVKPRVWLVTAFAGETQYAGNLGYADDVRQFYRYDSNVPNCRQLAEGDQLLLRGHDSVFGLFTVVRIETSPGMKHMRRCPVCERTSLKERRVKLPRYRCDCGAEFENPNETSEPCTEYVAYFASLSESPGFPLDMNRLAAACPRYNGQLAIQEIHIGKLGDYGALLRGTERGDGN